MITDKKAEELEAKGLYRRAAARWAEVMMQVNSDQEREEAARRRSECIARSAYRYEEVSLNAEELRRATDKAMEAMGIAPDKNFSFNNNR
ncbi:PerC family transcriptional regulator [Escherichia coli]|nr:PerC family transcriptional regulator [Escherichia coli]EHR8678964.1 PerC family transcriptional regulator [Escherichia coli]EHR8983591.1 PerC family transcriptional regulator [Escherichia coli]EHR9095975.1 PerC family transcriptional regulator [Escherichia coli]EHR9216038.1 PerC family transcriptional regulator [Escherichia coli]